MSDIFFNLKIFGVSMIVILIFTPVVSPNVVSETVVTQWQKTYFQWAYGQVLIKTSDGGYAIGGGNSTHYSYQSGHTLIVPLLIKTDQNGNLEWVRNYREQAGYEYVRHIVQTKDFGYLLFCGSTLIKTDNEGNVLWAVAGFPASLQSKDEGFLLFNIRMGPNQTRMFTIYKTDVDQNILWSRDLIKVNDSMLNPGCGIYDVIETSDGDYAATGFLGFDCWLLKIGSNGDISLNETYRLNSMPGENRGEHLLEAENGRFIIAGIYVTDSGTKFHPCLARINALGQLEEVHDSPLGAVEDVIRSFDGGFIAVGDSTWVGKADADGRIVWNMTFGFSTNEWNDIAHSVIRTSDGSYTVTGSLNASLWLAKFTTADTAIPSSSPSETTKTTPAGSIIASPSPSPTIPETPTTISLIVIVVATIIIPILKNRQSKRKI